MATAPKPTTQPRFFPNPEYGNAERPVKQRGADLHDCHHRAKWYARRLMAPIYRPAGGATPEAGRHGAPSSKWGSGGELETGEFGGEHQLPPPESVMNGLVAGACFAVIHNALGALMVRRWSLPKNGRRTGPPSRKEALKVGSFSPHAAIQIAGN